MSRVIPESNLSYIVSEENLVPVLEKEGCRIIGEDIITYFNEGYTANGTAIGSLASTGITYFMTKDPLTTLYGFLIGTTVSSLLSSCIGRFIAKRKYKRLEKEVEIHKTFKPQLHLK